MGNRYRDPWVKDLQVFPWVYLPVPVMDPDSWRTLVGILEGRGTCVIPPTGKGYLWAKVAMGGGLSFETEIPADGGTGNPGVALVPISGLPMGD